MVETISPVVHGARTWLVSVVLFTLGATAAGATVGLALGVALQPAGGPVAWAVGGLAAAYALHELDVLRLPMPQVRRQVPESLAPACCRCRSPAGLYGVLLGLGFTTFILTLRRLGAGRRRASRSATRRSASPIGLAFGAGRRCRSSCSRRSPDGGRRRRHAAMAERPRILRSLRAVDAVALAACAVALVACMAATAGQSNASDPSVDGALRRLARGGPAGRSSCAAASSQRLGGAHPALGQGRLAVTTGSAIEVQSTLRRRLRARACPRPAPTRSRVSRSWVAWRVREGDADVHLRGAAGHRRRAPREVDAGAGARPPGAPGRPRSPSTWPAAPAASSSRTSASGSAATARQERRALLLNPSLHGRPPAVRARDLLAPGAAARPGHAPRAAQGPQAVVDRADRPPRRRSRAGRRAQEARPAAQALARARSAASRRRCGRPRWARTRPT